MEAKLEILTIDAEEWWEQLEPEERVEIYLKEEKKCSNEVPCRYNNWNHKCGDVCGYDVATDKKKEVVLCDKHRNLNERGTNGN